MLNTCICWVLYRNIGSCRLVLLSPNIEQQDSSTHKQYRYGEESNDSSNDKLKEAWGTLLWWSDLADIWQWYAYMWINMSSAWEERFMLERLLLCTVSGAVLLLHICSLPDPEPSQWQCAPTDEVGMGVSCGNWGVVSPIRLLGVCPAMWDLDVITHSGSSPDHIPLASHVRLSPPINVYPFSQLYCATEPREVASVTTVPWLMDRGSQSTATHIKKSRTSSVCSVY